MSVIEEIERIDNGNPIHDPGKIERPAKSGYAAQDFRTQRIAEVVPQK